jgi:hypothetical protein
MSKDTKIRIAVTVTGWLLAAIIQAFSFGYFFGALKTEVKGLGHRLDLIEQQHQKTEVKNELEKNLIVWHRGPRGRDGEQCAGEQRQRGSYPGYRGNSALASDPDFAQRDTGSVLDSSERPARLEHNQALSLRLFSSPTKKPAASPAGDTAFVQPQCLRTPAGMLQGSAGARAVGEN